MKRDARCLVVAGALACGSAGTPPPGGASPNTGAVTTIVPSETDARVSRVEELLRGVPGLERSEEHTSELQSQSNLVCRLLLEKKKNKNITLYKHRTNKCRQTSNHPRN